MLRGVLAVLTAALIFSAMASASASASEWLLNKKAVTESTPVTLAPRSGHVFTLEDRSVEGVGKVTITCAGITGKGTVAPEGQGTITAIKLSKCTESASEKGPCGEEKKVEEEKEWVTATNLPSKIALEGATAWVGSRKHDPGWRFECEIPILKSKLTGECKPRGEERYKDGPVNITGGVALEFPGEGLDKNLTCGNAQDGGQMFGAIVLKGPEGKELSFK